MEKSKRITSLQGLRAVAFVLVYIWHLNGYFGIETISLASFSVTFFFMLSGFVSELTIEKNIEKLKGNIFKRSLCYSKNKMSKIYTLYFTTLILYIPLSFKNMVLEKNISIYIYAIFLIINFLFLQTWFKKNTMSISYAGWYLSGLAFLNVITIPLHKLTKKINPQNFVVMNFILIFLNICLLYGYSNFLPHKNIGYALYFSPLFRYFEYFIGLCLANIYKKTKDYKIMNCKFLFHILEIISILICVVLVKKTIHLNFGFENSFLHIMVATIIILIFMYSRGFVSKILSLKPIVFLGDISGSAYLIHNVLTAYLLGIATRIFPNTLTYFIVFAVIVFILTIYLSYLYEKKGVEKILKILKDIYYRFVGKFKKKKLKCKNFTIISNNCFAGVFYRNNALSYLSPTCGLFIMPKDYIKFIYDLKKYLKEDMTEINIEDSKYSEYLKEKEYKGVIGKIKDIEIMFLHYKSFSEAKEKWIRRSKRINFENIIYKFNDQNGCTYDDLINFEKFNAKNKLCFTAKKYKNINSIVFEEFESNGYVLNDSKEKIYRKYINMYDYINERFGKNEEE